MRTRFLCAVLLATVSLYAEKKPKHPPSSPFDNYVRDAEERGRTDYRLPGAVWQPGAQLSDLVRDPKAARVDDLVTIVVAESASAVSSGTTKTSRSSNANATVASALKPTRAAGPLANLLNTTSSQALDGKGTTTRDLTLTTTLSARVVAVLPNGYMAVEGSKTVVVNSETHVVTVRGVARPADITAENQIQSDRLAQMEVRINGKGVVGDAVRRPFILYRLLLGLLPF